MITVQDDWIEYEVRPLPARRVAVRGGAACAQRMSVPVGMPTQSVLTMQTLRPVAAPRPPGSRPGAARGVARSAGAASRPARLRLTRRGRIVLVALPAFLLLSGALLAVAPGPADEAPQEARHDATHALVVDARDAGHVPAGR